jgi:hypothetical protein
VQQRNGHLPRGLQPGPCPQSNGELDRSGSVSLEAWEHEADSKGAEFSPIEVIHRHSDGVVTFHKKEEDLFDNLFAIRAEHLSSILPDVRGQLESDAFMSMNAYWHREKNRHYLSAVQCRRPNRLRYLCACYADLDFYKLGLSYGQVIGTIVDDQDKGVIPPVSIIVRSGRGLWLVWLLRDYKNQRIAPRAWPEKLQQYVRIQQQIHERLDHLGADAHDALRLIRVPGSVHSVAGGRVRYFVQADEAGRYYTYTLDDLAARFGVQNTWQRRAVRSPQRSISRRSRGPKALTEYRVRDFLRLVDLRQGGFDKGCRNHAALYYAWLLKCQRIPIDEALGRVTKLGRACRPPLSLAECRGAVKTGYNRNWRSNIAGPIARHAPPSIKYQTVSDWLDITPQEAKLLTKYPPASRFSKGQPKCDAPSTRKQAQEIRHAAICRIVAERKAVPSLRHMVRLLEVVGCPVSQVTVMKDYFALGLDSNDPEAPAKRNALGRFSDFRNI